MDIIDFVFDSEFYKTSCMGSLPIENGKELDHYRENVLKECLPFNSDLDVDMFNTWVSGDLTNNDEVKILTNALKNFFQKSKYKKLTQTILDHASHSLENWDEMFETFKDEDDTNTLDLLFFAEACNIDVANLDLILISYYCHSEKFQTITKEEFVQGMGRMECDSVDAVCAKV